jgi:N-methylhydantoinase A
MHVGPQSAGSTPGPACYGNGGTEPTVTDANLVLGRLNPGHFLGGEMSLDVAAAKRAVEKIAGPLGYTGADGLTQMADGVIALATVIMAGAIKQISVQHGLDPREFVLFCYGGGGPLHGSALARELSIPTVVIPPEPGNFSAVGMLLADARLDLSKTFTGVLNERTIDALGSEFAAMEAEAREALVREFGAGEVVFERFAEMRYSGQRHNIKVPISGLTDPAAIREAFARDYKRRYGHADARAAAEFQALHLSALTRLTRPELARVPRAQAAGGEPRQRPVYFGGAGGGTMDATVYERTALPIGFKSEGPALIEEYGSTTLIWPGDTFEIGALGEIRISCARG